MTSESDKPPKHSRRSFLRRSAEVAGGSLVVGATPTAAKTSPSDIGLHVINGLAGEFELVDIIYKGLTGIRRGYKIRYDMPGEEKVTIGLVANFTGSNVPQRVKKVTLSGTGTVTAHHWEPNVTDIFLSPEAKEWSDASWLF